MCVGSSAEIDPSEKNCRQDYTLRLVLKTLLDKETNRAFWSYLILVSNPLLLHSEEAIWGKVTRISLLFMREQLI